QPLERGVVKDVEPRDACGCVVAQHALGGRRVGDRQAVVRARRGERIEERAARVAARDAPQLDVRRHRRRGMIRRSRRARREQGERDGHQPDRPAPRPHGRRSGASVGTSRPHHGRSRVDATVAAGRFALTRSEAPRIVLKKRGMKKIPMVVANSMPANTPVPIEWRLAAPAPLASMSGSTPRMNANDVMRMGRSRSRAASTAASCSGMPCPCSSFANSTIRIAFFAASPTTAIMPTWKYTSLGWPRIQMPSSAPSTPNGTPSSTANGTDQLSYCAARTRNTINSPSVNTSAASPLETRSWYDCPEYDTPTPDDANCDCTSESTSLSSSPELRPGFGAPVNCADVKPLKRCSTVGALRYDCVVSAESGIMAPPFPRTYSRPMSSGFCRNCSCASACTRYVLPNRLKSLMYSAERKACIVPKRSPRFTPRAFALSRFTVTYTCGTLARKPELSPADAGSCAVACRKSCTRCAKSRMSMPLRFWRLISTPAVAPSPGTSGRLKPNAVASRIAKSFP